MCCIRLFVVLVRWALFLCVLSTVSYVRVSCTVFYVFCCLFVTSVLRTVFNVFCWIVCHVSSSDTVLHVFCLIVCHVSCLRTVFIVFFKICSYVSVLRTILNVFCMIV